MRRSTFSIFWALVFAMAALFAGGGCGGGSSSRPSDGEPLVIYFSRTGTTKAVAELIASRVDADTERLIPTEPYSMDDDECGERAQSELNSGARPPIEPIAADIANFGVIYLGYPIWYGDMPMALYTFLEGNDLSGKIIRPFCTSDSGDISGTPESIGAHAHGAVVSEGLSIKSGSDPADAVEDWLAEMM